MVDISRPIPFIATRIFLFVLALGNVVTFVQSFATLHQSYWNKYILVASKFLSNVQFAFFANQSGAILAAFWAVILFGVIRSKPELAYHSLWALVITSVLASSLFEYINTHKDFGAHGESDYIRWSIIAITVGLMLFTDFSHLSFHETTPAKRNSLKYRLIRHLTNFWFLLIAVTAIAPNFAFSDWTRTTVTTVAEKHFYIAVAGHAILARAVLRSNSNTAENAWLLATVLAFGVSFAQTIVGGADVLPPKTLLLHEAFLGISTVVAAFALFKSPKKSQHWIYNPFFEGFTQE